MSINRNNISEDYTALLNNLDELTLEETEKLLIGIEKVTIPPDEENYLKAKIMDKAGIEEWQSIQELKRKPKVIYSITRRYMKRTVACIAALMVCSIVAIAATHMEGLQRYWGDDTKIYRDISAKTIQSVQNENLKINIEGIVADKYQCIFIFSVEALNEEGQKIIKKNKDKHHIIPLKIEPKMLEGFASTGIFEYTNDNKNKDYNAYECDFQLENVDLTQPVILEFAGLTMKFDIPPFMQVITLYSNTDEEPESVEISPLGYYYKSSEYAGDVRLIKKDGTLDEEMGYFGAINQKDNQEIMMIGSFTKLIDLNNYLGLQINGNIYMRTEN